MARPLALLKDLWQKPIILKASLLDGHLSLPRADEILRKMIRAGFYPPIRSPADIA